MWAGLAYAFPRDPNLELIGCLAALGSVGPSDEQRTLPSRLRASRCCLNVLRGRLLSTFSLGTPPLRAISTPQCVRSISLVECASGLMLIMQPSASACSCQRQSRSRRQGFALISTATPYFAQAASTFS